MTAPATGGRHREFGGLHRARRSPAWISVRVGGAGAVVAGVLALALPAAPATPPVAPPAAPPTTAAEIPVPVSLTTGSGARDVAPPTRVRVPAIGVDSSLVRLRVNSSRALVPPSDFATAGWFTGGPAPGETGPAVLAGHVDSFRGPAVFYRLAELAPGNTVLVDRADGTSARFTVTAVDRYPKDEFPSDQVYGPTPRAELRLITCGGEFDRAARSYRDNVVVSAVLAG